jgi:putative ABC transport system substrate-binding protein
MMDRRRFLVTSLAGAFAAPLSAQAQQAGKVYRVGILGETASDPSEDRLWQSFRVAMRERGWIEGKNLLIESRWAEGNPSRLPELAADLVRLKVDVIVTRGSIYTHGARTATSSVPIVFTMHADPEKTGHIASLARPGGNITGLSIVMTDLNVKGLELLTDTVPSVKHIAVLGSPDMPSYAPSLRALQEAARRFQLKLQTKAPESNRMRIRPPTETSPNAHWRPLTLTAVSPQGLLGESIYSCAAPDDSLERRIEPAFAALHLPHRRAVEVQPDAPSAGVVQLVLALA